MTTLTIEAETTFKCDYCDEKVENIDHVPEGWLVCRFRNRDKTELTPGPTACPWHVYQLRMVTAIPETIDAILASKPE